MALNNRHLRSHKYYQLFHYIPGANQNQPTKQQQPPFLLNQLQPQNLGGRRRKHPAKPGRHICPYCGRGCAKPSVLQKHIRAHTGERPYPCTACNISFKTKSNLYKHCKSRAHRAKVRKAVFYFLKEL